MRLLISGGSYLKAAFYLFWIDTSRYRPVSDKNVRSVSVAVILAIEVARRTWQSKTVTISQLMCALGLLVCDFRVRNKEFEIQGQMSGHGMI